MATYAIRVHHNETDSDASEDVEYEMTADDIDQTTDDVRMRLMEAMNINLANLAASLERIACQMEAQS